MIKNNGDKFIEAVQLQESEDYSQSSASSCTIISVKLSKSTRKTRDKEENMGVYLSLKVTEP